MINKIKENDYVVIEAPSYHLEIVNKRQRIEQKKPGSYDPGLSITRTASNISW
jgi:hypothetical protein